MRNELKYGRYVSLFRKLEADYRTFTEEKNWIERNGIIEEMKSYFSDPFLFHSLSEETKNSITEFFNGKSAFSPPVQGNNPIGCAFFPAIGLGDSESGVLRLQVTEEEAAFFPLEWIEPNTRPIFKQRVIDLLSALGKEVFNNNKHCILNWKRNIQVNQPLSQEAVFISGDSHTFAFTAAFVSHLIGVPVPDSFVFTGTFDTYGNAARIEGIQEKVRCITTERKTLTTLFLPDRKLFSDEEKKALDASGLTCTYITSRKEFITKVFLSPISELIPLFLTRSLNTTVSLKQFLREDITSLPFTTPSGIQAMQSCTVLEVVAEGTGNYNTFPLGEFQFLFPDSSSTTKLVVINARIPVYYAGYIISINRQSDYLFAVRKSQTANKIIVFADPRGNFSHLLGAEADYTFNS